MFVRKRSAIMPPAAAGRVIMEVILLSDVKALGKKNQLVKVSDGYARNFLLPRKLAIEANASNKNVLEQQRVSEEHKKAEEKKQALEQKEQLEKTSVTLKAKGSKVKLFGAVTAKEVAESLSGRLGFEIDKKKISMPENIKTYGEYTVELRLYPEISAVIKLSVVPEEE